MHLSFTKHAVILGGFVAWGTGTAAHAQQQIQTVFVISMENHNLTQPGSFTNPQQILGNAAAPYLNSLMTVSNPNAAQTSFARNYQNAAPGIHPSEPNYIWSQAGSNFGVLNDNPPFGAGGNEQSTAQNLTNILQTAGITWKSYQEDTDINLTNNTVLPSNQWTVPLISKSGTFTSGTNAYNGSNQYSYAAEHDPQIFFLDTSGGNDSTPSNPLAHNYAPLQQLQIDLANNTVARYNWITPDHYNDAHSSLAGGFTYHGTHYTGDQAAIAQGDNFLSIIVPQIQASQAYRNNGVIIIWFDETEGGDSPAFTIPEIIMSPLAKGNAYSNNILYTHSSDLLTTEEIFGVGPCIGAACSATDLSDLFLAGTIGASPTLTSITPASGSPNTAVNVTLRGTSFTPGTVVRLAGAGAAQGNVVVVNSTTMTATFTLSATAATGPHNVYVLSNAGASNILPFTVVSAPPTLTSVSPAMGAQGTATNVTLTGSNFVSGATVSVSGSGVTASNVVVVSATQITATLNISATAAPGSVSLTVATTAGTSGTVSFTVIQAGPTLTSISPSTGSQGSSVPVTLTGTNFAAPLTINASGTGITPSNVAVVSSTRATANLTIAASATIGQHNVSVTTTAGTSANVAFGVTPMTSMIPTLTSITPPSGSRGAAVNVTLTGTNFIAGTGVRLAGMGAAQGNVVVVNSTTITATFTLSTTAATGPHNVYVLSSAGSSNILPFTVN
jgi:hypothetical protein